MKNKLTLLFSVLVLFLAGSCSKDDSEVTIDAEGTKIRFIIYSTFEVPATNVLGFRALDTTIMTNDIEAQIKAVDPRLTVGMIKSVHIIGARLFFKNPNVGGHNFDFLGSVEAQVQAGPNGPLKVTYLNTVPTSTKNLDLQFDHENNYQAYFDQNTFAYILKGNIVSPLATPAVMTANIALMVKF